MSKSIWDDPKITAYVLGELPDEDRTAFERELESDSELAAAVDEARGVTAQLKQLYADEPTPPLDAERRSIIVQDQLHAASPAKREPRWWKIPAVVLATAATLLLLVGAPVWIAGQRKQSVTQMRQETLSRVAPSEAEYEAIMLEESLGETEEQPMTRRSLRLADDYQSVPEDARELSRDKSAAASEVTRQSGQDGYARGGSQRRRAEDQPAQPSSQPAGATSNESARTLSQSSGQALYREAQLPAASPAPSAKQGLEMKGMAMGEAGAKAKDVSALRDQVEVEFESEPGVIVMRGSKRDVKEVEKRIQRLEAAAPPSEVPALSLAIPADSKARFADADGAQTYGKEAAQGRPLLANNEAVPQLNKNPMPAPDAGVRVAPARPSTRAIAPGKKVALEHRRATLDITRGVGGADYGLPVDEGRGPGIAGDRFEPITENPFKRASEHPLSTFSIDVDTASYSKTRDFLMRAHQLPRPDAVRIEELVNYFDYEYDPPSDSDTHPLAVRATVTACPWNDQHRLARIALKGKTIRQEDRPACNLVFLLDTSGSMNAPNKMPLVIEGMQMLLKQLNEKDKVAITVYAGSAGLVLDSTSAKKSKKIRKALTQLSAGGSTNGGAGIALAYQTARDNFIPEGVNRVILCTDGDFNVGLTGTDELVRMVERESKGGIFLSVLGFGMGNHNDAMLEKISGRGNGNYAFIDDRREAHKVLVNQTSGTLVTIAKDVKLQVDFNPSQVSSYRLIGYENRMLAKEDFNDDKKDAGEIGAGHAVTALYEIVPAGVEADASRPMVDESKYQTTRPTEAADSGETMTLRLSYKQPDGDTGIKVQFTVLDEGGEFKDADHDFRFAAAVASFGMQLRRSEYAGSWTMSDVIRVADDARGEDMDGLRAEFVDLARKAGQLMGSE